MYWSGHQIWLLEYQLSRLVLVFVIPSNLCYQTFCITIVAGLKNYFIFNMKRLSLISLKQFQKKKPWNNFLKITKNKKILNKNLILFSRYSHPPIFKNGFRSINKIVLHIFYNFCDIRKYCFCKTRSFKWRTKRISLSKIRSLRIKSCSYIRVIKKIKKKK